jgi:uncharacterized protein DUF5658
MWRRVSALLVVLPFVFSPDDARAQDVLTPATVGEGLPEPQPLAPPSANPIDSPRSKRLLTSLYVSTVSLQMLDAHSTCLLVENGGREANPMLAGLVSNPPVFYAAKAGVAAASILAARSLAKHNKKAAIITLIAMNGVYAAVVTHNYRAANAQR